MHGCNTIQMATFVDLEKATIAVMQQLLAQNKDIWIKMRSIEVSHATRHATSCLDALHRGEPCHTSCHTSCLRFIEMSPG